MEKHLTRQGAVGDKIYTRAETLRGCWVPERGFSSRGKTAELVRCDTRFHQIRLILEAVLNENRQRYERPSDCCSRALQHGRLKREGNPRKRFAVPRVWLACAYWFQRVRHVSERVACEQTDLFTCSTSACRNAEIWQTQLPCQVSQTTVNPAELSELTV